MDLVGERADVGGVRRGGRGGEEETNGRGGRGGGAAEGGVGGKGGITILYILTVRESGEGITLMPAIFFNLFNFINFFICLQI